jgi:SAM-dependent methyltransferase
MSYIYKTGRTELHAQVTQYREYIHGRVLDVGAGSYPRYRGIFTYDEYITMNVEPGKNTDIVGRIENIPSPDNAYDSIVCTQVLGDVYELKKAWSELYRVLRPGGSLLVTENLFDVIHDEPYDFWRFTEYSLRKLAEESGFTVTILEKRGGYRSVMAQLRARYLIERFDASRKWYARFFSIIFKIDGEWARFWDKKDTSRANKIFTHGYILIAHKHG